MKTLCFTIYDTKAEVYLPPFFVPTRGIATRAFADCVNSEDHQFSKHPHDYTLFELGEFFDHDASFLIKNAPKSLGNGVEFIELELADSPGELQNEDPTPVQSN